MIVNRFDCYQIVESSNFTCSYLCKYGWYRLREIGRIWERKHRRRRACYVAETTSRKRQNLVERNGIWNERIGVRICKERGEFYKMFLYLKFSCFYGRKYFQKSWSIIRRNDSKDGMKVQYRCSKVKQSGPQCPAAIYLLYHSDREAVSLFRVDCDHDHQGKQMTRGIDPEIRRVIVELYEEGMWIFYYACKKWWGL